MEDGNAGGNINNMSDSVRLLIRKISDVVEGLKIHPDLVTHYTPPDVMRMLLVDPIMRSMLSTRVKTVLDVYGGSGLDARAFAGLDFITEVLSCESDKSHFDVLSYNLRNTAKAHVLNRDGTEVAFEAKYDLKYFDPPWGGDDYLSRLNEIKIGGLSVAEAVKKALPSARYILVKLPYAYPKSWLHDAGLVYGLDFNKISFLLFSNNRMADTLTELFHSTIETIWLVSGFEGGTHAIKTKKGKTGIYISESLTTSLSSFGVPKSYASRYGRQYYMIVNPRHKIKLTKKDFVWSFGAGGFELDNMDVEQPLYVIRCKLLEEEVFPLLAAREL